MPKKREHNPFREKLADGSVIERDYRIIEGKQVPSGNWKWVCYDALRRPKSKKVNLYTSSKGAALKKAILYVEQYGSGTFDPWDDPARKTATMAKATESFLSFKAAGGASPNTVETDRYHLERFGKSFPAGIHVGNIRTEHIEAFLSGLGKPGKPASGSYRNRVRASLSHFFEWASTGGMIQANPASATKPSAAAPVQRDYITEAEYEAIMDAIAESESQNGKPRAWLRDWIAFGWGTGLRPSEQRLLKWHAVRLNERNFKVGEGHRVKTKNSRRTVAVAGEAFLVLERLKDTSSKGGDAYVFTGAGGEDPPDDRYLSKTIQGFAEKAGVGKNITAYCLRHGYGTRMIQAGVPAFELARMMGTSLKMIEDHYGHFDPLRAASHVERVHGTVSDKARQRSGLGS